MLPGGTVSFNGPGPGRTPGLNYAMLRDYLEQVTGHDRRTVNLFLRALRDCIHSAVLDQGFKVNLFQVGTFYRRWSSGNRGAGTGRARWMLAFKASRPPDR